MGDTGSSTARHAGEQDGSIPLRAKVVAGPLMTSVIPALRIVPPPAPPSASSLVLVLALWVDRYQLTRAESAVLLLAAEGLTLLQIAHARGTTLRTARKQSETLREKTFDDTLTLAANRLLGEACVLADPRAQVRSDVRLSRRISGLTA